MKKMLKIVVGCLTLLWAVRSLIRLPTALTHAQTAAGAGEVAGLALALFLSAALTIVLFRSAFRKPDELTERLRGKLQ
jgi:hypothetical protein